MPQILGKSGLKGSLVCADIAHSSLFLSDSFQYIDQDTLLPPEDVPTFNSNLIEAYFHLIPNLTERFIVLNDDYLMAKPIHPEVFFTKNGGVKMFLGAQRDPAG